MGSIIVKDFLDLQKMFGNALRIVAVRPCDTILETETTGGSKFCQHCCG